MLVGRPLWLLLADHLVKLVGGILLDHAANTLLVEVTATMYSLIFFLSLLRTPCLESARLGGHGPPDGGSCFAGVRGWTPKRRSVG